MHQKENDLVAVMGGEPEAMYKKAIQAMGGMSTFVKRGQKVVVKPNIGWDKKPELSANTNPLLVAAIVKDCLNAGASEVVVFDHTCDEWQSCYKNSGIEDAVKNAGGRNFIKAAILSSIAGAIELKSSNLFAKESVVASKRK